MKSQHLLLVILLGFILFVRLFFDHIDRHIYKEGEFFRESYSFAHEPKKNGNSQYFYIGNIFVKLPPYPRYYYADKIRIEGVVESKKTDKGKMLILNNPKVVKEVTDNPVLLTTKLIRDRIINSAMETLPGREGGLLLGIVLGVRDKIDQSFYKELRNAGVLHVIAASGQNVTILASLLLFSFERFVKRKNAILFTSLLILFYSLLAGLDPPIVRASMMALLSFGALLFGRQNNGLYILSLTGWGMLMQNPGLLQDISFQLSFLSTFGIISIKPMIDNVMGVKHFKFIKESFSTTLSAQIATLPLMLSVFGSYSLISLPVNILVLWTIPVLMVSGGAGAIFSLIDPQLGKPLFLLSLPFLSFFSFIADIAAHIQLSLNTSNVPESLIFGYYLILIAIVIKYNNHERGKI